MSGTLVHNHCPSCIQCLLMRNIVYLALMIPLSKIVNTFVFLDVIGELFLKHARGSLG
jgi:hypothetical protein